MLEIRKQTLVFFIGRMRKPCGDERGQGGGMINTAEGKSFIFLLKEQINNHQAPTPALPMQTDSFT